MTLDNLSLKVLRSYNNDKATAIRDHELFYSLSKFVPLSPAEFSINNELSVVSQSFRGSLSSDGSLENEKSGSKSKGQSLFSPDPDEFGVYSEPQKSGEKCYL